jgi:hypothetical protein
MAGEMNNVAARKMGDNFLYSRPYIFDAPPNQKLALHVFLDGLKFLFGAWEWFPVGMSGRVTTIILNWSMMGG